MSQAQVWDARTYKPIGDVLEHGENLRRAEFDATATKVLTVGRTDGAEKDLAEDAKLWDARTGKLLLALRHGDLPLTDAALSPDGKMVATCNEKDSTIRLWNTGTGKQAMALVHQSNVESVQFDPSGTTLVTTGPRNVSLWDVTTGKFRAALADFSPESVPAISGDGKRIAFADYYFFAVFDLATAKKLYEIHPQLHLDCNIQGISLNADGTRAATSSLADKDCGVVWDLATGKALFAEENGLSGIPVFSPDGTKVIFNTVPPYLMWDVASRRPFTLNSDYAAFSPDSKRLAISGSGYTAILDVSAPREN